MKQRQREQASHLRQQVGELLRELAAELAEVRGHAPLVKGSLYGRRRRRRDGAWQATEAICFSEHGHTRHVALGGRAPDGLRQAVHAYQRFRRARAQLCKRWAGLLQRIDQLEVARRVPVTALVRATAGPRDGREPTP